MKAFTSFLIAGAITTVFLAITATFPELLLPSFIGYVILLATLIAVHDYTRRPHPHP